MNIPLAKIKRTIRNPLVIASLILGIIGAPLIWYSGVLLDDCPILAGVLFACYMIVVTVDAVITLTLIINRD